MRRFAFLALVGLLAAGSAYGEGLKIVSPNGGESWLMLAGNPISWTFTGFPESRKVTLILIKDGVKVGTIASGIPIGKSGAGSWTWTTGVMESGGSSGAGPGFRVRIKVDGSTVLDQSDQAFTIHAALTVQRPKLAFPAKPPVSGGTMIVSVAVGGTTQNKAFNCPYSVAWDQGTGSEYIDPGPGTVQVGFYNWADDDGHYSGEVHRCWVFFDVGAFKGKGVVKKAAVKLGPKIRCVDLDVDLLCKCERLYVLDEAWNGDPDVLMHSIKISPCPADLTPIVAGWVEHPETNYGLVYLGREDLGLPCGHNNMVCMNEYKSVVLDLDVEVKK